MLSRGFNSGERDGSRIRVMFLDIELVGRAPAGSARAGSGDARRQKFVRLDFW
jgi:hypothetical protein